jgi:hypothetical protein
LQDRLSKCSSDDKEKKELLKSNEKELKECTEYMKDVQMKKKKLDNYQNEYKLKQIELTRHINNLEEEIEDDMEQLIQARDNFQHVEQERKKNLRKLQLVRDYYFFFIIYK